VHQAKRITDEALAPDGYNLGWNVGSTGGQEMAHVHLHVIPRFADELHAGKGIRWLFKQPENRRPGLV
jgi:histidine triad (HIT) family protein